MADVDSHATVRCNLDLWNVGKNISDARNTLFWTKQIVLVGVNADSYDQLVEKP